MLKHGNNFWRLKKIAHMCIGNELNQSPRKKQYIETCEEILETQEFALGSVATGTLLFTRTFSFYLHYVGS
jgi:hypothetical protein